MMMEAEVEAILGRSHQPRNAGRPRSWKSREPLEGSQPVGMLILDVGIPEFEVVDSVVLSLRVCGHLCQKCYGLHCAPPPPSEGSPHPRVTGRWNLRW